METIIFQDITFVIFLYTLVSVSSVLARMDTPWIFKAIFTPCYCIFYTVIGVTILSVPFAGLLLFGPMFYVVIALGCIFGFLQLEEINPENITETFENYILYSCVYISVLFIALQITI